MSRARSDLFAIHTVLGIVASGAYASWLLLTGWWWNRGTTLVINEFLALAVVAAVAGLAALAVLRYWFRIRRDLSDIPEWNLKHDRPGLWVVTGTILSLISAGGAAWVSHTFVRTTVPHLGGQQMLVEAVVQSVATPEGDDGICEKEAVFLLNGSETLSVCLERETGYAPSAVPIENGQTVAITVAHNFLGTALLRVDPFEISVETPDTSLERTREK